MRYSALLPSHRALLFARLGQALQCGHHFPGVFQVIAEDCPPALAEPLRALHRQITAQPGEPLLQHLERSGVFLAWELRLLKLGLATLRIPEVCARLCDYYRVIEPSSRRLVWCLLAIVVAWWLLPAIVLLVALVADGAATGGASGLNAMWPGLALALALGLGSLALPRRILQAWISPDSWAWRGLMRWPLGRACQVARSLHQYLLNLGLCVQCGLDIVRAARLSGKAESVGWIRERYLGVATRLEQGETFSSAFVQSGLLSLTTLEPLAPGSAAGNGLWSPGVTDIVRQSCVRQLARLMGLLGPLLIVGLLLPLMALLLWVLAHG